VAGLFNNSSANLFSDFINAFGMVDLRFSGNPYTWSNHRQCLGLIKERLDRSIATNQWIHFFLPPSPPPLSLDLFVFEELWTRDHTCGIVVKEANWLSLLLFSKEIKEYEESY
jgi:hypothetical protein